MRKAQEPHPSQFKRIHELVSPGWKGHTRTTLMEAPLSILNLKPFSTTEREPFKVPNWWGHQEFNSGGADKSEGKKGDDERPARQAAGIATIMDPPDQIFSAPFTKRMIDENTQTLTQPSSEQQEPEQVRPNLGLGVKLPAKLYHISDKPPLSQPLKERVSRRSQKTNVKKTNRAFALDTVESRTYTFNPNNTGLVTPVRKTPFSTPARRAPISTGSSPFSPRLPPADGIYAQALNFLHGPIIELLDFERIDPNLTINSLIDSLQSASFVE